MFFFIILFSILTIKINNSINNSKIKKENESYIYKKNNMLYKEIYYSNKNCQIFTYLCNEYKIKVIKIVLVVIIKNENLYIKEFIDHYFFIGVDNNL